MAILGAWAGSVGAEAANQGFSDIYTVRMRAPMREPLRSIIVGSLWSTCDVDH